MLRDAQPRAAPSKRSIVIGASTGGVEALHCVLSKFPADCPPVFIVQHMRPNFLESFVAGLNRACLPKVEVANDRTLAHDGHIYVAPSGDRHLMLGGRGGLTIRLIFGPPVEGHRPSIDRLFQSATTLQTTPAAALLTGMGRDGAMGLLLLRKLGAPTFAQDEATSVVYGMPKAAADLNAAARILPLPAIGPALLRAAGYETDTSRAEI